MCLCTHWPGEGASAGSNNCWPIPWAHSLCCRHPEGGRTQGSVQRRAGPRPEGHTLLWTLLFALRVDSKGPDWDRQTARSVSEATVQSLHKYVTRVVCVIWKAFSVRKNNGWNVIKNAKKKILMVNQNDEMLSQTFKLWDTMIILWDTMSKFWLKLAIQHVFCFNVY